MPQKKETKSVAEQNHSKYLLVSLANNEQVNKTVWNQILKNYPKMDQNKLDLKKPDELLNSFAKKTKLIVPLCCQLFLTLKLTIVPP